MKLSKSEIFQSLPEIDAQSEIKKKRPSKYVNANLQFDPYFDVAPFQNVLITFDKIANLVAANKEQRFIIVQHPLDYPTNLHYHDYIEGIYVLNGRVLNIINHLPFLIESGGFCLINKNTQHLIAKLPDDRQIPLIVNFLIHPDLLHTINQAFPDSDRIETKLFTTNHFLLSENKPMPLLESFLNSIVKDYEKNNFNFSYKIYANLLLSFSEIIDSQLKNHEHFDHLTKNCLKIIQENPAAQSLENIANVLNYSKSYISRHIKNQTGQTVSDLITDEKLILAGKYLSQTELTIEEIAKLVGYESESHFYRIFKKKFQVTPKQYRKLYN